MIRTALLLTTSLLTAQEPLPFDAAHWNLGGAKVAEHLGRPALTGFAALKDTTFRNGVITFDVAATGARSYPGLLFRSRPGGQWERIYLRPHRAGRGGPSLYGDVVQYLPAWNRSDAWQLYSGPGFTAGSPLPADRWFTVKLEVAGTRARVSIDGAPVLEIPELRHGLTEGGLALMGPADGSAWFSQVRVRSDETFSLPALRLPDPPPGLVTAWEVSPVFPTLSLDEAPGLPAALSKAPWKPAPADAQGLVDVARVHPRTGAPDTVFLRTTLRAAQAGRRAYRFGYSDTATLYLNGVKVFEGDSAYQGRDPSFLGILGLHDTVHLDLKAGDNTLVVALGEVMGGWGWRMQEADAIFRAPGLQPQWQTGRAFHVPESVAWDPKRRVLYVSSYDPWSPGDRAILRLAPEGGAPEVLVRGLGPTTGLAVQGDRLYAVEPQGLAVVDLAQGALLPRVEVPGAVMLNDVAVAPDGVVYVSDPGSGTLHRIRDGKADPWLRGPEVARPNGLLVENGRLLWCNNGDGRLKAADLGTQAVRTVADLSGGLLDGLSPAPGGGWLVSHHEGRLYRVRPEGDLTLLLDQSPQGQPIADFTWIPERRLLVVPTFTDNRVVAYRME